MSLATPMDAVPTGEKDHAKGVFFVVGDLDRVWEAPLMSTFVLNS